MLEFIRTHRRLMQVLLLLVILPSFAFVGLESYTRMGDAGNTLAKVAGQTITQQEFDAAHRQQMDRLRQMFGGQIDTAMFDTPQARQEILDGLIAQRALLAEAVARKLTVTDATLQQTILAIPDLTNAEGQFDVDRYRSLLAMQGMSPQMFEARLRQDLVLQNMNGAIQGSAFVPRTVAEYVARISEEEREFQEQLFAAKDYLPKVALTEEMMQSYYQDSGSRFEVPEQIKAEYLVLSLEALAKDITVSDADIRAHYEQNAQQYSSAEERRASHILIGAAKDASSAEHDAAKAKAEALTEQLRANPDEFARLAKENSQDPGSAENGGDLGFFAKGMMVKPFEDAAWALAKGQISAVVASDFGYHIIRLTDIRPGANRPLDEVRTEIAADIKQQLAAKRYTELAENFANIVYEQADSLAPAAQKLGLEIQTADKLTRSPNPELPKDAPYNQQRFLQALYADDALANKHNTEALEVAQNTLIAGRVVQHQPASKRPFESVKEEVRKLATEAQAQQLAAQAGAARLEQLRAEPGSAGFGASRTISRARSEALTGAAFDAVMKAGTDKLPVFVGAEMPGIGYGVFRINKVSQPENPDAGRRESELQQLTSLMAQQESSAYVEGLKAKAKVKMMRPVAAQ